MKSESWLAILGTVLCFGLDSMKVNLHISLQTGALEGQNARVSGQLVSLSEQQLVDCDSTNYGCNGGWPSNALAYIQKNGGTCACINISFTCKVIYPNTTCKHAHSEILAISFIYIDNKERNMTILGVIFSEKKGRQYRTLR